MTSRLIISYLHLHKATLQVTLVSCSIILLPLGGSVVTRGAIMLYFTFTLADLQIGSMIYSSP